MCELLHTSSHGTAISTRSLLAGSASQGASKLSDYLGILDDLDEFGIDGIDAKLRRFCREARQGTFVMHFAASGAEALDRLAGEIQPRLAAVLPDINMPGMDGRTDSNCSAKSNSVARICRS